MVIRKVQRILYKTDRLLGDAKAVRNGSIVRRLARRMAGRTANRILNKIFKY
ncbi:MAG TPA: hypothetical protein VLQ20_02415 [Planococcus sp. (in: firmicutes)]|nr:hypothetical protein [Planococcus sp. (in: firmicutes)]